MKADHIKILTFLAQESSDERCWAFDPICRATGLDRKRVRFICRMFRRKGWARFYNGLCSEDGDFGGSGYCISPEGMGAFQALNPS